jgi:cation diffusion facilitator CzcD-associated flavoprotein CzcO
MTSTEQPAGTDAQENYDVVVIGAGVSGMYALHHLREIGLSVRVYDGASDIGGTWWYNRYPGARVDGPGSPFYGYTFSNELMEWDWAETQSEQSAVLDYLEHVADRFDLRRDIQFETWVEDARYDEAAQRWTVETSTGVSATAQFLICAVGALSTPNMPDIPGINEYAGEVYHTGRWPHEPVSFRNKRVAVIGTGSSGIQSIPEIAREADHLIVLQRTAQFSFPAGNRPITPDEMANARENFDTLRETMHANSGGFPVEPREPRMALDDTPEQRRARYEELWQRGGFKFFLELYSDIAVSEEANATLADFVREKIREIVHDPETAKKLMPEFFVMTKRPILDNGYFETFNRENVTLVDLREDPIERFTDASVVTRTGEHPIDMLVLATGYDAISGSMLRLNPKGRGGLSLKDRWNDQFHNYLGLSIAGFPNLFMIHGPGSPGVFYNMPLGAERQINWIGDFVRHLREQGMGAAEPTADSEAAWGAEVSAIASATLFPRTDSWWTGANIPGKPRLFSAYLGGTLYYQRLADASAKHYEGFVFEPALRAEGVEAR